MKTKIVFCLFVLTLISQNVYSQFSFGVNGGITSSNMSVPFDKLKSGIRIGFSADYLLTNHLVLISGLDYTVKGANNMQNNLSYSSEMKIFNIQLGYLQLPILLGYKFKMKNEFVLTPVAGFYFSYGIWGNSEIDEFNFDAKEENRYIEMDWNPYSSTTLNDWGRTSLSGIDRFDYGISLGLQAEYSSYFCKLYYDFGLPFIWDGFGENIKDVRNRSIAVGFGYKFKL